jgi:biotin carboxylase
MVASELFYSPTAEDIDYEYLKREHDRLVETMGLPFGITHTEYMYSNGKFYLIEIAARGGGTKISSDIVPAISGVQTNELLISMALGERIDVLELPVVKDRFAILAFFNFEVGKVSGIIGMDEIKAMTEVLDIAMNFAPGQRIEPPADDRGRHGYFIAKASNSAALQTVSAKIRDTVRILYE